ncbi:hypothetical protein TEA_001432 [Camellia sinensis var. sinensis]|uniref:RRM domain-containing protein n=1 Tax=Camellia sinensis var. sinensis TaxID=542762 RepID=A0A4S4EYQ4_CAMSN|nr:hypothetical protein TEA_001432 [Camellia sinensis var. sinensis]
MSDRKLVVLGIPWDIDTDGLKDYMSKFGELEDCIVMKERSSGRSRGFGYVTFASVEDAKEEMKAPSKKVTRIFVARIPPSVTEAAFRSYFEQYGDITDLYMPKDPSTKGHRGIGFITFATAESVDNLMAETHELGGSTIVVDRATPKAICNTTGLFSFEEEFRPMNRVAPISRVTQGGYGAYNAYITAATTYAALGAPTLYDHPGPVYGTVPLGACILNSHGIENLFARNYTFHNHVVAIDSATPVDDAGPSGNFMMDNAEPYGGGYGPMRTYGRMYGSLDFDDWGYGMGGGRPSRTDTRPDLVRNLICILVDQRRFDAGLKITSLTPA